MVIYCVFVCVSPIAKADGGRYQQTNTHTHTQELIADTQKCCKYRRSGAETIRYLQTTPLYPSNTPHRHTHTHTHNTHTHTHTHAHTDKEESGQEKEKESLRICGTVTHTTQWQTTCNTHTVCSSITAVNPNHLHPKGTHTHTHTHSHTHTHARICIVQWCVCAWIGQCVYCSYQSYHSVLLGMWCVCFVCVCFVCVCVCVCVCECANIFSLI